MNAPFTQVRQVAQYPRQDAAIAGTVALMQMGEAGSPYASILVRDLVTSALAAGGNLNLAAATGQIAFVNDFGAGAVTLSVAQGELLVSTALRTSMLNATFVNAQSVSIGGFPAVTQPALDAVHADNVHSFNFRQGDVQLEEADILRAGGAPIANPNFSGWVTAPSHWDVRIDDDTVATARWVHDVLRSGCFSVRSFNGRSGCVTLRTADVNAAYAVQGPPFPTSQNPPFGDASSRIATTLFVDEAISELEGSVETLIQESQDFITQVELLKYAPLDSPQLTGIPTAPTAGSGNNTGQLATTAFVMNAIVGATTGVVSFNTRTGAVTFEAADLTGVGGALLSSPAFTGIPTAPSPPASDSSNAIATTSWVLGELSAISAGVLSWNGRSGAVTMTTGDITGAGGAPLASPALAGVPTAPTAAPGTSTGQLATTAFVMAAVTGGAGVVSFNGRAGAVTLQGSDVSAAGGALNASPAFTGIPTAPTAAGGTSSTQIATTAFVAAALAGASVVSSFNSRVGAVTLTLADVTGVGGAPLASPIFTGTPAAPTPPPGTNSTQLATTAFVVAAAGGVKSIHIQKFTTPGAFTYTPSAGMMMALVEMVGGGGGAGGATGAAAYILGGGGGGGGAYSRSLLTAAQIGASQNGVVGSGGANGNPGNGAAGTVSSLGSLMSAAGGSFGTASTTSTSGGGGAGGSAGGSVGDVTISGMAGGYGTYVNGTSVIYFAAGWGGGTLLGSPQPAGIIQSGAVRVGFAGTLYGGGGTGGIAHTIASTVAGGPGQPGVVIITEFCSQ